MSDLRDIATLCKEIDCLTAEVDTLRKERDNLGDQKDIVIELRAWRRLGQVFVTDRAADVIETLRKERDNARQMYCELLVERDGYIHSNAQRVVANDLGWDCFKEDE